ncbi:hypothetical protein, partial [Pseudoalteromonas sp. S3173]|uniref:hypothetical protein n=1 Tax=Pseudoalteromonas sp. S3173 TaxID=579531 RepID=UPI001BB1438E
LPIYVLLTTQYLQCKGKASFSNDLIYYTFKQISQNSLYADYIKLKPATLINGRITLYFFYNPAL